MANNKLNDLDSALESVQSMTQWIYEECYEDEDFINLMNSFGIQGDTVDEIWEYIGM